MAPDLGLLSVLLCDADGNLFPSEEPAFDASCDVMNALMEALGDDRRFAPDQLRLATTGLNFRTTASSLIGESGGDPLGSAELELWVTREADEVTRHLAAVLEPDEDVRNSLIALEEHYELAGVSSSASPRLDACFGATDLDDLIPGERRFSAEDSLEVPTSKPDPAIYLHTLDTLGISPRQALAIEDSVPGVMSAVSAGIPALGNVTFVPRTERSGRIRDLLKAGAYYVAGSWTEIRDLLTPSTGVFDDRFPGVAS